MGGAHPIPTRSSRPKTSPRALPREIVQAIIGKRAGGRRCGQVIHEELRREGVPVSLSSVHTLERTHLLKSRSPWKRLHDATPHPLATHPGALSQADTVHLRLPDGSCLYVYPDRRVLEMGLCRSIDRPPSIRERSIHRSGTDACFVSFRHGADPSWAGSPPASRTSSSERICPTATLEYARRTTMPMLSALTAPHRTNACATPSTHSLIFKRLYRYIYPSLQHKTPPHEDPSQNALEMLQSDSNY
jgi:hypothetical protein